MFLWMLDKSLPLSATLDLANSSAMLKKLMTRSKKDVKAAERYKDGGDESAVATDLAVFLDVTLGLNGVLKQPNNLFVDYRLNSSHEVVRDCCR